MMRRCQSWDANLKALGSRCCSFDLPPRFPSSPGRMQGAAAIVIGTDAYEDSVLTDLEHCVRDADLVESTLLEGGFCSRESLISLRNPSRGSDVRHSWLCCEENSYRSMLVIRTSALLCRSLLWRQRNDFHVSIQFQEERGWYSCGVFRAAVVNSNTIGMLLCKLQDQTGISDRRTCNAPFIGLPCSLAHTCHSKAARCGRGCGEVPHVHAFWMPSWQGSTRWRFVHQDFGETHVAEKPGCPWSGQSSNSRSAPSNRGPPMATYLV